METKTQPCSELFTNSVLLASCRFPDLSCFYLFFTLYGSGRGTKNGEGLEPFVTLVNTKWTWSGCEVNGEELILKYVHTEHDEWSLAFPSFIALLLWIQRGRLDSKTWEGSFCNVGSVHYREKIKPVCNAFRVTLISSCEPAVNFWWKVMESLWLCLGFILALRVIVGNVHLVLWELA